MALIFHFEILIVVKYMITKFFAFVVFHPSSLIYTQCAYIMSSPSPYRRPFNFRLLCVFGAFCVFAFWSREFPLFRVFGHSAFGRFSSLLLCTLYIGRLVGWLGWWELDGAPNTSAFMLECGPSVRVRATSAIIKHSIGWRQWAAKLQARASSREATRQIAQIMATHFWNMYICMLSIADWWMVRFHFHSQNGYLCNL